MADSNALLAALAEDKKAELLEMLKNSKLVPVPQKNLLTPELARYASPVDMQGNKVDAEAPFKANPWRTITDENDEPANPKLENEVLYVQNGIYPPNEYGNDSESTEVNLRHVPVPSDNRTADVSRGQPAQALSSESLGQALLKLLQGLKK